MAGEFDFPTTIWTIIRRSAQKDEQAFQVFFERYYKPVIDFIKSKGIQEIEAEDLTQDVFLRITKDEILRKAEKEKGKFRSFLLAIVQNVLYDYYKKMGAKKREAQVVSLDEVYQTEESTVFNIKDIISKKDAEQFNKFWVNNLVNIALEKMKQEHKAGSPPYHEILSLFYLERWSYKQIQKKFNCSKQDIANWLYQGKVRLRKLLVEQIRLYCSSPGEFDEETTLLNRLLGR